jgi:hypothetical protein
MRDTHQGSTGAVDAEATIVDARAPGAAGRLLAWLLVIRSEDQGMEGQLVPLFAPETVLGRGGRGSSQPAGHVRFHDLFMSEPHALLTQTGDPDAPLRMRERPGAPTNNGTFHNGRRLGPGAQVDLRDGDRLRLGTTELVVKTLWLDGELAAARGPR